MVSKRTSVPTTHPPKGFTRWDDYVFMNAPRPSEFEFVEVWRKGDMDTRLINPRNMNPAISIHDLYWRPVKAYGEVEQ
jgi:hypothetical protein